MFEETCDNTISLATYDKLAITINGTLGEFLSTLATLSIQPIPITTRPNIKVPVGETNFIIDADTHSRDARHFETLGDCIERVEPPLHLSIQDCPGYTILTTQ